MNYGLGIRLFMCCTSIFELENKNDFDTWKKKIKMIFDTGSIDQF